MSVDPNASQNASKTPYHYASNNPVNRVDPSGGQDGSQDPNNTNNNKDKGGEDTQKKQNESLTIISPYFGLPESDKKGGASTDSQDSTNSGELELSLGNELAQEKGVHTIEEGETYSDLAKKYDVSVQQLKALNQYKPKNIPVGADIALNPKGAVNKALSKGNYVFLTVDNKKSGGLEQSFFQDSQKIISGINKSGRALEAYSQYKTGKLEPDNSKLFKFGKNLKKFTGWAGDALSAGNAAYITYQTGQYGEKAQKATVDFGAGLIGGFIGGATTGAVSGSVVPGVGNAIGFVVGGASALLIGKFGKKQLINIMIRIKIKIIVGPQTM